MNSERINLILDDEIEYEICRKDFWEFCLWYDFAFFSKRLFLKQVAEALQRIFDGKIRRLSVSLPPRSGKSYIVSLFAAWCLGIKPEKSIMRNTCTATLYNKLSYDTRNIIRSEKYKQIFPKIQLADDRQNLEGWSLRQSKQGAYFGAGVGGTIIGFGCSLVAITDDLYKSIKDALSETSNNNVHQWKDSAHDSRIETGVPVVDIGTRWSKRDVIGKNIEKEFYDESIIVPALDETGQSFCEDVKTTEEYTEIRHSIVPEIWSAEYMQDPVEAKGLLFKKGDLKRFKMADLEALLKEKEPSVVSYIDVSDGGGDYLSMPIGKIYPKKIYISEVIFTQLDTEKTQPMVCEAIQRNKIKYTRVESNNQGGIFAKNLRREVGAARILPIPNTKSKQSRIWEQYGFIKEFCLFLDESEIEPGSQYDLFMRNIFSYMSDGSAEHDDAPDSLAGLCAFIESYLRRMFPSKAEERRAIEKAKKEGKG